ncbi:MAG: aminomethyltransferase family protein [Deltaproteobacteria bacterium]|nr:aminomethyltransferase family protein [Deltaproteobacteria bacterium]
MRNEHERLGATMERLGPVEAPLHYGDPVAEHLAVRNHAGVADLSHRGLWRLSGPDAERFLQGILTNDIASLRQGQGCYALSLTGRGKIVSEVIVLRRSSDFLMHAPAETREAGFASLDRYLVGDDAALTNEGEALGMLGLFGPAAPLVAAGVLGGAVAELPDHHFVERPFAGATVLLAGASWTGEKGFEIIAPAATLPGLWGSLLERIAAEGGRAVGGAALDTLRIEAGYPRGGVDFGEDTLPQTAGLEKALDHKKGCYRGQEIVLRVHTKGQVKHLLMGLLLDDGGAVLPPHGTKLERNGTEIGWITSAALSPTLKRPLALGYLDRDARAPGTRVEVKTTPAGAATVAELPFYGAGVASAGGGASGGLT